MLCYAYVLTLVLLELRVGNLMFVCVVDVFYRVEDFGYGLVLETPMNGEGYTRHYCTRYINILQTLPNVLLHTGIYFGCAAFYVELYITVLCVQAL